MGQDLAQEQPGALFLGTDGGGNSPAEVHVKAGKGTIRLQETEPGQSVVAATDEVTPILDDVQLPLTFPVHHLLSRSIMRRVTHALKGLSPKPEADDAHLLHTLGQGLALRRLAEPSDFAQDRRSRRSMPRG